MPGQADFSSKPTDPRLESAMQTVAKWHRAAAACVNSAGPSSTIHERTRLVHSYQAKLPAIEAGLSGEADELFRQVGVRITTHFRRLSDQVLQKLEAVSRTTVLLQPCIRDIWHDHLLFTGDELTGLIDFGAVRTETVACDLSRLLGSLFRSDSIGWGKALAAYEAVSPLTESESVLLQPLDHSGVLLSGMTWLKRRYLERTPIADISRVCDRLEKIAERLSSLAS